jgi:hypothetical protein
MKDKDAEQSVLLALIRSALWGEKFDVRQVRTDAEIRRLLFQAHRQSVIGLATYTLIKNSKEIGVEESTMRALNGLLLSTHHRYVSLSSTLVEVDNLLRRAGVRPVLLKGQGAASNYPHPSLRQCGNMDLFVGRDGYEKSIAALRRMVPEAEFTDDKTHCTIDYHGATIELHSRGETMDMPICDSRFQQWVAELFENGKRETLHMGNDTIDLPSVDYNAFFMFHHAWHHFMSDGIGLRLLCDWAVHLHTYADVIDRAELKQRVESFALMDAWRIFASIAVDYLGLPADECPMYDPSWHRRASRALRLIMRDGTFGLHSPLVTERPKGYLPGLFHSLSAITRRHFMLMRISPRRTMGRCMRSLYTNVASLW